MLGLHGGCWGWWKIHVYKLHCIHKWLINTIELDGGCWGRWKIYAYKLHCIHKWLINTIELDRGCWGLWKIYAYKLHCTHKWSIHTINVGNHLHVEINIWYDKFCHRGYHICSLVKIRVCMVMQNYI